jgi:hypothetical protein
MLSDRGVGVAYFPLCETKKKFQTSNELSGVAEQILPDLSAPGQHAVNRLRSSSAENLVVRVATHRVGMPEDGKRAAGMALDQSARVFISAAISGSTNDDPKLKRRSSTRQHATGTSRNLAVLYSLEVVVPTRN